jgi:phage shock protein PspC (stress-responsive transcriptional regulator)
MSTTTAPTDNSLAGARAWFAQNELTRPEAGRMLAGVSAGFARRYGINPLVSRLATLTVALVLTPLVYLALWALMPKDAQS